MLRSVLAISLGASIGAILRWRLGLALNSLFPTLPLGTLTANMLGGYLIGIALALFSALPTITHEWRLFVVTGFLGSLTTFSTFSAEVTTLIQQGRVLWAGMAILAHTAGSITMTLLGLLTISLMKKII